MNICFVTSEFVNPIGGGVERVTYNLYKALQDHGHDVYIISKEKPLKDLEMQNDKFVHLLNPDVYADENKIFVRNFITEHNIEYIVNNSHHQTMFDLLVSVKEKQSFKLISVYHTDPNATVKGVRDFFDADIAVKKNKLFLPYYLFRCVVRYYLRKQYQHKMFSHLYDKSDAIVLLSERFIPDYLKILGLKESDKVFAISNPIIKEFVTNNVDKLFKGKNVIFVGRMEREAKRPDRMIHIWERIEKQFPDWRLYMIGDGVLRTSLEAYCKRNNLNNVIFTGRVDPKPYYEKAEVLCATSTYEGFGLVLTETMQYGTIPIAFDSYAAVHDIIEDEYNGLLIRPFNIKEYAKRLSNLLDDNDKRIYIRKNIMSDTYNSRFDIDVITSKWIRLFEKL